MNNLSKDSQTELLIIFLPQLYGAAVYKKFDIALSVQNKPAAQITGAILSDANLSFIKV